jgi:tRNA(Ile)-lysidine synthase
MDFLIRTAKNLKVKTIALGHTRDDQAETVLMHLLRGSGLSGLAGIAPKRNIRGLHFIRPLIEIERKDVEAYLKKKGLRARRDASNKELVFFRNRVRHKLLPYLTKGYNHNIKESLANAAQIFSADYDYLYGEGLKALKRCSNIQASQVRIDLVRVRALHPAMQRMVLRLGIEKIKGNTRRLTFRHWKEIETLITSRKTGSVVDLPGGLVGKKTKNHLLLALITRQKS